MSAMKHQIEYKIHQKNCDIVHDTKEVEERNHILAAWKLQQEIKNEVDPYGDKGINVIVNLNH